MRQNGSASAPSVVQCAAPPHAGEESRAGGTAVAVGVWILTGLQVQVGAICPGPRSRSGTAPSEYH